MAMSVLKQCCHTFTGVTRGAQTRLQIGLVLSADIERAAKAGKGPGSHWQGLAVSIEQFRGIGQPKR
ncbi:hypothetical protein D3C79_1096390 [compost metagenome]